VIVSIRLHAYLNVESYAALKRHEISMNLFLRAVSMAITSNQLHRVFSLKLLNADLLYIIIENWAEWGKKLWMEVDIKFYVFYIRFLCKSFFLPEWSMKVTSFDDGQNRSFLTFWHFRLTRDWNWSQQQNVKVLFSLRCWRQEVILWVHQLQEFLFMHLVVIVKKQYQYNNEVVSARVNWLLIVELKLRHSCFS